MANAGGDMNVFRRLKIICAALLLSCLFLPLSQCTRGVEGMDATQKTVVSQQYAFRAVDDADSWLSVLAFAAPLGLLTLAHKAKRKKLVDSLVVTTSLLALYCVARATFFGEILIGGCLAFVSSAALILLVLFEWARDWWLGYKARLASTAMP